MLLDFIPLFVRIHQIEILSEFLRRCALKICPRLNLLALAVTILFSANAGAPAAHAQAAQENYTPSAENLKSRAWFQDAKFGMFIHWGVYSVLGDGEWIMETRPINRTEYAKVPSFFNPIKFDPAARVALAKAAGTNTTEEPTSELQSLTHPVCPPPLAKTNTPASPTRS